MSVLETRDLTVTVADISVCEALTLGVEAGQRWAILGRNGVGKTTLLHTLAGLRAPRAGSVRVGGEALGRLPPRRRARQLGLLPQDSHDPFPSTVMETALIGRHPHIPPWRWEEADDRAIAAEALADVGLERLAERDVATLSGGERRRLAVATLITQAPQVWLLDEPSNHLDLHHQIEVLELLHRRIGDGAALIATHDVNLAARFCDHALLLFGEGASCHGPLEHMLDTQTLSNLYAHPIRHTTLDNGRRVYVPE